MSAGALKLSPEPLPGPSSWLTFAIGAGVAGVDSSTKPAVFMRKKTCPTEKRRDARNPTLAP